MKIDTLVCEQTGSLSKIALLEEGRLSEVEFFDENQPAEGNVYLGRITRKLDLANGKTGYFVNFGGSRDAFLNADETGLKETNYSEGQSLVVQVMQERRAEKGPKVMRGVQLAGEYIVYCPYRLSVEASAKIEDKLKVQEYRQKVIENTTGQEGWILRTSSVEVPFEKIAEEMEKLRADYEEVLQKARKLSAPAILLSRPNPLYEVLRRYKDSLRRVVLNSRNTEAEIKKLYPELETEIDIAPFKNCGIEEALSEALNKTVNLPNSGRIIIEETRACVAVDVDSGDDKANGNLARLNIEAAEEIARQIKLRNLSGKIIIDFAGSSDFRYLKPVIEALEAAMADDYVKSSVLGLSRGGSVEVVRVRKRPSLSDLLTEPCESCLGTGRVAK